MSAFSFRHLQLAEQTLERARASRVLLATAESCTGGLIAALLTEIPGSSEVFERGFVTYSNCAKVDLLRIPEELITEQGAVSEPVARRMAEGAIELSRAQAAVAVTGIAGPGGGTRDKPVGTVYIALAGASGTVVERRTNSYEREAFKQLTAQQALEMLRLQVVSP